LHSAAHWGGGIVYQYINTTKLRFNFFRVIFRGHGITKVNYICAHLGAPCPTLLRHNFKAVFAPTT
jgi:hypothetical protein